MSSNKKTLVVWLLGGTGPRVCDTAFTAYLRKMGAVVHFVDAAPDPVVEAVSEGKYYHVRGDDNEPLKGGGADRINVMPHALRAIPDILSNHEVGDFNITVNSGGGASGDSIKTGLVAHFIANDIPYISLMSTSTEAHKQISNSVAALKTAQAQAKKTDKNTIVMNWHSDNPREFPKINESMRKALLNLAVLTAVSNFDHQDVLNWLTPPGTNTGLKLLTISVGMVRNTTVEYAVEPPSICNSALILYNEDSESAIPQPTTDWCKHSVLTDMESLEQLYQAGDTDITLGNLGFYIMNEGVGKLYAKLVDELKQIEAKKNTQGTGETEIPVEEGEEVFY